MADIDALFKKPTIPSKLTIGSSKKRKLEPTREILEQFKSARTDPKGKGKAASVADDDGDGDEDMHEAPAEHDVDFVEDEDEEGGRFFGGGVSREQAEILDYMDEKDGEGDAGPEKIDVSWLRKTALNFEKKISKNAEMRGKFEDEPEKFMASEVELDEAIKSLSILSEHPDLYEEFANLGCVGSLVGLLTHENSDIAGEVVEVISELTDEDVDAEAEQWMALVDAIVDADGLDMLVSNLSRLDEKVANDRNGVYHTLSVMENLASHQATSEAIGTKTTLLAWLIKRLQARESPITQNKQYAGEVLAILLQSSAKNREKFAAELNGVDVLLQLLSPYRKRDPVKGGEEEELLENIFDAVTCVVQEYTGKEKFVEAEGVELALIMLREGKMSKSRALRLLDHACGSGGVLVCERLVEAVGLKTVFGMFMKKQDASTTEHLLGIFASLLRNLPADTAPRIRTLAKFVEKEYEKIERVLEVREGYVRQLKAAERGIEEQRKALDKEEWEGYEAEWFSRRLDAGLFCLQMADTVLAWVCAEDDGARGKVVEGLRRRGLGTEVIRETLKEQLDSMEGDEDGEVDEETRNLKEMLATLIQFV